MMEHVGAHGRLVCGTYTFLAYLDWLKGDWSVALEEVERTLEMAREIGFTSDSVLFGEVTRGLIRLGMGYPDQAENYLATSNARQSRDLTHLVNFKLALGKVKLEQGKEDEARACFEACVDEFKTKLDSLPSQQVEALFHLTTIYARHGALDEARRISDWARLLAEALKGDACFALASQAEASLLLASGDEKGATEAYLRSLDLWEKAGWLYYHAKALVNYSDALAQENPEESKKRMEQAAEIFRKLGAKRDLERAENKLSKALSCSSRSAEEGRNDRSS